MAVVFPLEVRALSCVFSAVPQLEGPYIDGRHHDGLGADVDALYYALIIPANAAFKT
jgi:hypothetical protein